MVGTVNMSVVVAITVIIIVFFVLGIYARSKHRRRDVDIIMLEQTIKARELASSVYCNSCGGQVVRGDNYCGSCGSKINPIERETKRERG